MRGSFPFRLRKFFPPHRLGFRPDQNIFSKALEFFKITAVKKFIIGKRSWREQKHGTKIYLCSLQKRIFMADIKHLFHISAQREKVYEAISTVKGLSGWWTTQTSGDPTPNGILEFRFGKEWFNRMKVLKTVPNEFVEWEC